MAGQRIRYLVRAERGEPLGSLCDEFDIDRSTGWRWRRRLQESGRIEEVREKSRRPRASPRLTEENVQERILELRGRYGWGARKLQVLLAKEDVKLGVATVSRVLKRRGAIAEKDSVRPAGKRFERTEPNELWQMDFKGVSERLKARHGVSYPLSILDDCSRFALGLFPLIRQDEETTWPAIQRAMETYGLPKAMLMDHGAPWWSVSNGHGLTQLTVKLMKQNIRLYFSGVRHPQTQGKVERFHRTLEQALWREAERLPDWSEWAERFRQEYNEVRPHEALHMATPAEKYRPSARQYQPKPAEWEYEAGARVERLDSKGCVRIGAERMFVSEALAREYVCLEELNGLLLARFRNTYVRELDPVAGRTRPLLLVD